MLLRVEESKLQVYEDTQKQEDMRRGIIKIDISKPTKKNVTNVKRNVTHANIFKFCMRIMNDISVYVNNMGRKLQKIRDERTLVLVQN